MLYPQNDDRIVAIDTVTQLHPMYRLRVADRSTRVVDEVKSPNSQPRKSV